MAKNTIRLKNYLNIFEEMEASADIYPGMLLEVQTTGKVRAHNTADNPVGPAIALEDELQGKGIDEKYVDGDKVQVWYPQVGDQAYMILKDGQDIAIGAVLQSNGDGTLKAAGTGTGCFQALEAVDLSDSSGAEDSGPLGYDKRIKVRVIRGYTTERKVITNDSQY